MEDYKDVERVFYDSRVMNTVSRNTPDNNYYDLINKNAIQAFYAEVLQWMENKSSGKLLDYGCGTGEKSSRLASLNWHIYGVDISDRSIEIGQKNIINPNITLSVMDCENMSFEDDFFDIVFDFGTLSSLNQSNAVNEIARVLKPGGVLICLETLGHHPIANINRKIKMLRGKRTRWATNNIMRVDSWSSFASHFTNMSIQYFNILSIILIPPMPFLPRKFIRPVITVAWKLDKRLCEFRKIAKYAFKSVTVLIAR